MCGALAELDLSSCVALPSEAIEALLPRCPSLRTLNLSGCRRLKALRLASASLHSLLLCWCSQLASLRVSWWKIASTLSEDRASICLPGRSNGSGRSCAPRSAA